MLDTNGLHFLAKSGNELMFWVAEMSDTVIFLRLTFSREWSLRLDIDLILRNPADERELIHSFSPPAVIKTPPKQTRTNSDEEEAQGIFQSPPPLLTQGRAPRVWLKDPLFRLLNKFFCFKGICIGK